MANEKYASSAFPFLAMNYSVSSFQVERPSLSARMITRARPLRGTPGESFPMELLVLPWVSPHHLAVPDPACHPLLSVVIPVYKAKECLAELYRRLVQSLEPSTPSFELVLVEDGGEDGSWEEIALLARRDERVKGVKLSRNFGQHYAITAGLDHATGDWVVVMDCDLQDQPEEIGKLYRKAMEGYDLVFARRQDRNDSAYRKLTSKLFSLLYNYLGDIKVDNSIANFSIASRRVIACVRQFRERDRSFPILLNSVGFQRSYVDVAHAARFAGESSYTFGKLLDLAIQCIVSQSNKPLRLSIRFGFGLSLLSVLYGAIVVVRYLSSGIAVPGWTTLVVLMCFLGGLGFANMGILGLYLGKAFDEVKGRPLYCVEKAVNVEAQMDRRSTR
jgi:dolichol-phosphate mannosyltransferase